MIPEDCPDCGKPLFTLAVHRPAPSLSWTACGLLMLGCFATVALFWGGILAVREVMELPMRLLAFLWFPVALLPALGLGVLAYRRPRMVTLRCRRCGWQQRMQWVRTRPSEEAGEP